MQRFAGFFPVALAVASNWVVRPVVVGCPTYSNSDVRRDSAIRVGKCDWLTFLSVHVDRDSVCGLPWLVWLVTA
jgi:hypothetical protein